MIVSGSGASGKALVTADLVDDAVDQAIERVMRLGLPSEDAMVLRPGQAMFLAGLSTVDISTPIVATGVGDGARALGALAVLGINIAMLLVGGSLTLIMQRALGRHEAGATD